MIPHTTASHRASHRATKGQASVLPAWPGTASGTTGPAPTPGDVFGEIAVVVAVFLTLAYAATTLLDTFGL
ncbi:hypothetical protein [Azospirillum canadense]|uniref:hypothetical protein n=1 Tax=Azospirillum canadense TaxID=403962 RepID=UPI00222639ED|nr:hypothetical protein [Azospirillum canadense]MCW2243266.1 hypothetical protein [Azospirillum canadense]